MIFSRLNTKLLEVIILLALFSGVEAYSQGTDISTGKKNSFYLGINISPAQTSIINNGNSTITSLTSTKKGSVFCSIEAGYLFSKFFGISTGIGLSTYTSDLSLASFNYSYDTIDSDTPKENYTRFVSGKNIKELQKISFVNIPLIADIQIPINETFGLFLQGGVNFSIPVKKTYASSGIFTYEGYYALYDIHITGVPYEGFKENYTTTDEGSLKIKSFNTELVAAGGVSFLFHKKIQISLGAFYNKFLSDLSDYAVPASYRLSSVPDQMRSMMEGSSKASASALGLKLGIRYYLN